MKSVLKWKRKWILKIVFWVSKWGRQLWYFSHFLKTALAVAWQQYYNSMTTAWQQLEDYLKNSQKYRRQRDGQTEWFLELLDGVKNFKEDIPYLWKHPFLKILLIPFWIFVDESWWGLQIFLSRSWTVCLAVSRADLSL